MYGGCWGPSSHVGVCWGGQPSASPWSEWEVRLRGARRKGEGELGWSDIHDDVSGRCEGVRAGIVVGVGSTPGIAVDVFAGMVSDVRTRDGGREDVGVEIAPVDGPGIKEGSVDVFGAL